MEELKDKVALITGGTRGIGRAIALRLSRMGARVALNYHRNEQNALATLAEVRAHAPDSILIRAELEDDAQVRAMVDEAAQRLGGLDILVANAAATAFKPLLETKPHNLARTFNLSVGGFVAAVQQASNHLRDGGRIVMVSGIDSVRYLAGHGTLGAAKAALESMVRYFAFELGHRDITVNGVNMGVVDTDSSRLYFGADFERACKTSIERSAIKRVPTADEIAAIICRLCTPEMGFLTAQTLMVDGGLSLSDPLAP